VPRPSPGYISAYDRDCQLTLPVPMQQAMVCVPEATDIVTLCNDVFSVLARDVDRWER